MRCPNCGSNNPAGFKFCGECGTALAQTCPNCGSPINASMKFCGQCGTTLALPSPRPAAEPPAQAERRLVTVMFADVVGFTAAAEGKDPEDVRELQGRYFETCRQLVELYGGTLEKYIGDAVMAVWGAPLANEDDAERAVRSALDVVNAIRALGDEMRMPQLAARAAVLSGEAAVSVGAVGQGMVSGDLVNTASRLQNLAPPGGVLVGDVTHRLSEAAVVYEDFGSHTLKGKDEPIHAWRATRVVAARGGAQRSTGLEPPFVGRERELRLLKELFHATVDQGHAHLVSVTGIAGIGKSRLAWEFFKYIDGLAGQFRWHAGRCLAYGEGVTYWALAEMVRTRADILEAETGDVALDKLRRALEESIPDAEERRWLEPRLAQLIGLAEPGAADRQDIFAAWRRFYERLAEEMPTVMVFEDMQWADPSLVEFIDYLLDWSNDHRLFIVTLGRAGESRATSARGHTALHLEPLSSSAIESLVGGLVPGLPDAILAGVVQQAEGIPLYAVETVRMLLDRGLLVRDGAVYRTTGPIASLDVPDSLHALIAARLDGLDADERHLLQQAAVTGKTFTAAGLQHVSGRPAADVDALLTRLIRKEVLSVHADPRSPERGQYGFLQDLVRQVAYETLSKRDRKDLHIRVAEHLAQTFGAEQDEAVEVLASHYVEAYREMPDADDSAAVKQLACRHLARAGERTASLAASEEAQAYFDQAAELTGDPTEKAGLLDRAGLMALRRGLLEQATARFETAQSLFESVGDQRGAALVAAHNADIQVAHGHLVAAAERLHAAYDVLAQGEPDEATAVTAASLGRMLMLQERMEEARPYLEHALDLAEAFDLPEVFSQALNTKGATLDHFGRNREANLLLRHALDVALENGLWSAAFRGYNNLCVNYYQSDRCRVGIGITEKHYDDAIRIGDRRQAAVALSSRLGFQYLLGLWDDALESAEECVAIGGPELIRTAWMSNRFGAVIAISVERGEIEEARRWLGMVDANAVGDQPDVALSNRTLSALMMRAEGRSADALKRMQEGAPRWFSIRPSAAMLPAITTTVESALEAGDFDAVETLLRPIRALSPGHTPPSLDGLGRRYQARLDAAQGRSEGVEEGLASAAAIFHDAELTFFEGCTQVERAEWLIGQGRPADAAGPLNDAHAIFERLKARPWLERVEKANVAKVAATR